MFLTVQLHCGKIRGKTNKTNNKQQQKANKQEQKQNKNKEKKYMFILHNIKSRYTRFI
jgi:hypothetical protein